MYDGNIQARGDTAEANKLRDALRNKLHKVERYRRDIREHNRTKAWEAEPKKHDKYEVKMMTDVRVVIVM